MPRPPGHSTFTKCPATSAVIFLPSWTRTRRRFPAKARSTSTVIHVTMVARAMITITSTAIHKNNPTSCRHGGDIADKRMDVKRKMVNTQVVVFAVGVVFMVWFDLIWAWNLVKKKRKGRRGRRRRCGYVMGGWLHYWKYDWGLRLVENWEPCGCTWEGCQWGHQPLTLFSDSHNIITHVILTACFGHCTVWIQGNRARQKGKRTYHDCEGNLERKITILWKVREFWAP